MSIEKPLALIQKYGAVAVLFIWVAYMQTELKDVKEHLYNCYEERVEDFRFSPNVESYMKGLKLEAVLPDKPRRKKQDA